MPDDENGPQTPDLGADEWDESKHPRKDNGQFGSGSGSNAEENSAEQETPQNITGLLGPEYVGHKGQKALEKLLKERKKRPYKGGVYP